MTYAAILIPAAFGLGYCLGRSHSIRNIRSIAAMPEAEIIAFETLRARRAERETRNGR